MKLNEISVSVQDRSGAEHVFRFRPLLVRERFAYKPKMIYGGHQSNDYSVVVDYFSACFLGCTTLPDVKPRERGGLDDDGIAALVSAFGELPLINVTIRALGEDDLQPAQKKP